MIYDLGFMTWCLEFLLIKPQASRFSLLTQYFIYSILVFSIMEDVNKRINRLIGQLRGIEKMVMDKRDCSEILQQITAVKKAIDGLSKEIVISDICRIIPEQESKKVEKMLERAINL